jgi:hypothetical protein
MLAIIMRDIVVQVKLEVMKRPGGFGSFDRRRWWMLLDCGKL